jgi:hypothetical protein
VTGLPPSIIAVSNSFLITGCVIVMALSSVFIFSPPNA